MCAGRASITYPSPSDESDGSNGCLPLASFLLDEGIPRWMPMLARMPVRPWMALVMTLKLPERAPQDWTNDA